MALSILAAVVVVIVGLRSGVGEGFSFWLFCLAGLGVMGWAMVDSWKLARRTREDYQLKEYNRWKVYVLLVVLSSGGGIGVALYVRDAVAQAFVVPNNSMYPSVRPGDRLLVTKRDYLDRDPERGEVVVFRNPEDRKQHYIKRVVAVGGDTVEVRGGELYVNGAKQAVERGAAQTMSWKGKIHAGTLIREGEGPGSYEVFQVDDAKAAGAGDMEPVVVLKHHVFVLGDNRANSRDSRYFGPVPVANLTGKVKWIFFPGEDWSRLGGLE